MTTQDALNKLIEAGADIEEIDQDSFLVRDNGFHGFAQEEDPFIVDADDLIEMYEMYCEQ